MRKNKRKAKKSLENSAGNSVKKRTIKETTPGTFSHTIFFFFLILKSTKSTTFTFNPETVTVGNSMKESRTLNLKMDIRNIDCLKRTKKKTLWLLWLGALCFLCFSSLYSYLVCFSWDLCLLFPVVFWRSVCSLLFLTSLPFCTFPWLFAPASHLFPLWKDFVCWSLLPPTFLHLGQNPKVGLGS